MDSERVCIESLLHVPDAKFVSLSAGIELLGQLLLLGFLYSVLNFVLCNPGPRNVFSMSSENGKSRMSLRWI